MTEDIVERLRSATLLDAPLALMDEAADEIERLRKALIRITKIENEEYGPDWEEIERAREIAREALE